MCVSKKFWELFPELNTASVFSFLICLVSSVFSFGGQSQHDHHLSASQSSYLLCELCTSCQLGMNKKMVLNRQTQLQNNE